jgi:uncharacterized membrane protein
METCANCGGLIDERTWLCGKCGASDAQGSAASSMKASAPVAPSNTLITVHTSGALSYLLGAITGVIFLLIAPYKSDHFVRFHAFQSIFFSLIWLALWVLGDIFISVFEAMTGGFLLGLIIPICSFLALASIAYWIFLMFRAYARQQYEIPIVRGIAKWQASK